MAESPVALWLERVPPRALISVRLDSAADSCWVGEALGVEWRSQPLTLHHAKGWQWWSTSPGVWLIEGAAEEEASLYRLLEPPGAARLALTHSESRCSLCLDISLSLLTSAPAQPAQPSSR